MERRAAEADHQLVRVDDGLARPHDEREVLQAGGVAGVGSRLGRRVHEQVRARPGARRAVAELVRAGDERLHAQRRHDEVVVGLGGGEVGDVDPEVTEHHAPSGTG
jgi:hypothetical protein